MNILAHVPFYVPFRFDGATKMLHDYLKGLAVKHRVTVIVDRTNVSEIDGVQITTDLSAYDNADIVITQLGKTGEVLNRSKCPVIFISHSRNVYSILNKRTDVGIVYNAFNTLEALPYEPNYYRVCRPIIDFEPYKIDREPEFITLIGTNRNKGGDLINEIAEHFKDEKFQVVHGGYGTPVAKETNNITFLTRPNMREVYRRTKLLLILSVSESYCRVGVEAMTAGIPIVSTDCPGLKESLGDAAMYFEHPLKTNKTISLSSWQTDISQALMNLPRLSKASLKRSAWVQTQVKNDLAKMESLIKMMCQKKCVRNEQTATYDINRERSYVRTSSIPY